MLAVNQCIVFFFLIFGFRILILQLHNVVLILELNELTKIAERDIIFLIRPLPSELIAQFHRMQYLY